ncbi:unnamed protein product [Caenorhabditis nigoni]
MKIFVNFIFIIALFFVPSEFRFTKNPPVVSGTLSPRQTEVEDLTSKHFEKQNRSSSKCAVRAQSLRKAMIAFAIRAKDEMTF